MAGDVEWTPAFPGQRPPFQPGNQLAVTHGAYSKQRTDPIARRLLEEIATDPTTAYLAAPKFHAQLWQWAVAQARVEILTEYVDSMDLDEAMDSKAGKTSPLDLLRKWMVTALSMANHMGFTPRSAAGMGKAIASTQLDLATILSNTDTNDGHPPTPPIRTQ
jgi:hypothetical protein